MRWVFDDGGREAAGFRGKTGDCVTRAIAIATGLPYRHIYDEINALAARERQRRDGRKRSSARTGVYRTTYHAFLEALGWTWTPTMFIGSGCRVHLRDGELPAVGRFVVKLSGHVVAVVDGAVHDTYDPTRDGTRCVYGYFHKEG